MYLVCVLCIHSIGLGLDYIKFDPFCMHWSWSPLTWSRVGYQLNGLRKCIKSTSVMTWHWHWPIYSFPPHLLLLYLITIIVITGGLERYNSHTYRTVFCDFRDVGVMDEDGAISLLGRIADAVRFKIATEVVYPGPIEVVLCGIPAIHAAQVSDWCNRITWKHCRDHRVIEDYYFRIPSAFSQWWHGIWLSNAASSGQGLHCWNNGIMLTYPARYLLINYL